MVSYWIALLAGRVTRPHHLNAKLAIIKTVYHYIEGLKLIFSTYNHGVHPAHKPSNVCLIIRFPSLRPLLASIQLDALLAPTQRAHQHERQPATQHATEHLRQERQQDAHRGGLAVRIRVPVLGDRAVHTEAREWDRGAREEVSVGFMYWYGSADAQRCCFGGST